ncbi:MAG: electron transport complex subunit RsxC [Bacteroidales bacterium]|nr:electron transport complex subunit RsxC [Bacteroidales bacterium]
MLKTFKKGGVHPDDNKLSANAAITALPLPKTVSIPVSQHLGAPCKPVVSKGDIVKAGQVIAKGEGFVTANIHSSVSGTIQKIDDMADSSGYRKTAVVIEVQGDEWIDGVDLSDKLIKDISANKQDILTKVFESGIVGLGGATFPTHVKLSVPKGKKAEILIINGVECEPFLTADHRLMMEKGEEILIGTQILMKALEVNKAIIGIENNKPDAIQQMTKLANNYPGISVQALKVKYPQGGEKQLIKACTKREVPSGGLPIDVGAVVHNVGTAFAVYEAIQKNKPLVERIVTVTGKSVKKPGNFKVRIGTPVEVLIEAVGGLPGDTGKIINGGPMMGKALNTLEVPVVKGTSGILLFPEKESSRGKASSCIRCAKCVSVCPMGLEPFLLYAQTRKELFEAVEASRALDCIECGSCAFECPANLPLLDYIRLGKSTVIKLKRSRKQ